MWYTLRSLGSYPARPLSPSPPDIFFCPFVLGGFSRQEYRSGLPYPPPGGLPNPGIRPASLMFPTLVGVFFTTSPTRKPQTIISRFGVIFSFLFFLENVLKIIWEEGYPWEMSEQAVFCLVPLSVSPFPPESSSNPGFVHSNAAKAGISMSHPAKYFSLNATPFLRGIPENNIISPLF